MKNLRALAAAFMLTGCVSAPSTPEAKADPITCSTKVECDAKWSRAVSWVTQNSAYKIQTTSDMLIQTYGPDLHDTDAAFTVTRSATTGGAYEITFNGGCGNITWGCSPTINNSRIAFANFVNIK
jgi:hypothetical protein